MGSTWQVAGRRRFIMAIGMLSLVVAACGASAPKPTTSEELLALLPSSVTDANGRRLDLAPAQDGASFDPDALSKMLADLGLGSNDVISAEKEVTSSDSSAGTLARIFGMRFVGADPAAMQAALLAAFASSDLPLRETRVGGHAVFVAASPVPDRSTAEVVFSGDLVFVVVSGDPFATAALVRALP
ncbi:MAG: hypothetical protein WCH74_10960 [Chloroflexota bacterium]